jgi:2-polyprenyl-3-methyl-5-hydroxy-6-metoxy-1,4-benzoquinol methylase
MQRYPSNGTSIKQVPAILRLIDKQAEFPELFWARNRRVLDYGGGKYDELTNLLAERGVTSMVYDPFNRSEDHNKLVWKTFLHRRADIALCSNVLNVIKEPEVRREVLRDIKRMTKPSGMVFFTVYEGDKSSRGRKTTKGWQANRPTRNYLREIRKEFASVQIKGKLIYAQYPKED